MKLFYAVVIFLFVNFSFGQNTSYKTVITDIAPSLISSDHTSEGFMVTLNNGRIIHFFRFDPGLEAHHIGNKGKIAKRYSDDGGATWSGLIDVYSDSFDDRNINGGIVGNERIVMTFRRYDADSLKHIDFNLIYSDDGGETWSERKILNTYGVCGDTHTLISVPGKGYMNVFSNVNYIEIRYSHDGIDWSNLAYAWDYSISLEYKINESCFAYAKDGKMVGLMRNETYTLGGNYYQVVSSDSGTTWTNPISTNIADSFFCPSPKIFYDERHEDLWSIATDRRGGNGLNSANVNSEIWIYSNKIEDVFASPKNWTLIDKMKRPLPSIYRLYGYATYTKKKNGNYLIVFSEGSRKVNNKEDSDFYQFEIKYIDTSSPVLSDVSICINDSTPDLIALGYNVKWYKDSTFKIMVGEGKTYKPTQNSVGNYQYYATNIDSVTGYESLTDIINLNINSLPEKPISSSLTACYGEAITELIAIGENIEWFADSNLDTLLALGNTFNCNDFEAGFYNFYVTQSMNECSSLPETVSLNINAIPEAPIASNTSICYGEPIPELTAIGENIQWFADVNQDTLLISGNTFIPNAIEPGTYNYYLTQNINNCSSPAETVSLIINSKPDVPIASNKSVCYGDTIPELTAVGSNIKWFNDLELTNLLTEGSCYKPTENEAGIFSYFVIQSDENCSSSPLHIMFTINPLPEIALNFEETTINSGDSVQIEAYNELLYSWEPPIGLSSTNGQFITASPLTSQIYTVTGIDENGCTNSAIIKINVNSLVGISETNLISTCNVFPNPSSGKFTIESSSIENRINSILIIDGQGKIVLSKEIQSNSDGSFKEDFDLSGFSNGNYNVLLKTDKDVFAKPLILLGDF